ncbi:MAG: putative archaeal flagellar protein D/E [halophilic archaeon J07HX64]|jgi:Putative archaeal flagellar protein D/E|nr:MAG: putative archaeal flagellar protein D/E [halophilic archaeon J07HX64]
MELNPRDYDIQELREAAGADPSHRELSSMTDVDPAAFESPEAQLAFNILSGDGPTSRPYLSGAPDGHLAELLVLQWLEYLVARTGVHGTLKTLDYYRDLGWIDEDAERQLRTYLSALDGPRSDPPGLTADDHRTSLCFVERLASLSGR